MQEGKNKRAIEKTRMQERERNPDTVDRHSDRHAAKDSRERKEKGESKKKLEYFLYSFGEHECLGAFERRSPTETTR
jgi:hypothetical protein